MSWDGFLKSLETDGGKLIVLLFMIVFLASLSVVMLWTGHTPQEAGREMLVGAMSSMLGILYGYLKASGPRQ